MEKATNTFFVEWKILYEIEIFSKFQVYDIMQNFKKCHVIYKGKVKWFSHCINYRAKTETSGGSAKKLK